MDVIAPTRLDELLPRMAAARVLVVGDLMLDIYLRGTVSRVSPEAPVPVVHVTEEWRALGGAGNVANNVVALGATCDIVGCIGHDAAGRAVTDELERLGIAAAGVQQVQGRPTTVKTRVLARDQQVARYDRETVADVHADCAAALAQVIDRHAAAADVIILEDYNKGVLTTKVIRAAFDAGRRHARPVIVDPKAHRFFDYDGATVFKPNRAELEAALGEAVDPDDSHWMARTRERLGCRDLLVTLGEHGMALSTAEGDHVRVPAVGRSVYDVSGAGDTVAAVLAVGIAAGASTREAAVLANIAAAEQVAKAGVATVSPDELRAAVDRAGVPVSG